MNNRRDHRGDRDAFEEMVDQAPGGDAGAAARGAVEELAPARPRRALDEPDGDGGIPDLVPVDENTITVEICHQLTGDDDTTADLGVVGDVEIDELDLDPLAD